MTKEQKNKLLSLIKDYGLAAYTVGLETADGSDDELLVSAKRSAADFKRELHEYIDTLCPEGDPHETA